MMIKRIDQITFLQSNELEKQPTSLTHCCPRKAEIMAKYGSSAKEFLLTVTPAQQSVLYKNIHDCYFGDYPTLGELNGTYSPKAAQAWLIPQLVDLSEYCGVKEKFTTNQLNQCSDIIASDYFYLKVSEIMLFFARFKRCCYGRFYGSVDPLIITEALKKFCRERNIAYYEKDKKEKERLLSESIKHACSWEDYAERSGQKGKPLPSLEKLGKVCRLQQERVCAKDKISEIAKSLINNSYKCDFKTLSVMRSTFEKKYGCTPELFIAYKC